MYLPLQDSLSQFPLTCLYAHNFITSNFDQTSKSNGFKNCEDPAQISMERMGFFLQVVSNLLIVVIMCHSRAKVTPQVETDFDFLQIHRTKGQNNAVT
jgi:hypothetical protein